MKKKSLIFQSLLLLAGFFLFSCHSGDKNPWALDLPADLAPVQITDISKVFYDPSVSTPDFKKEFDFFQGSNTDQELEERRKDTLEIHIYEAAIAQINQKEISVELARLFARVQHYFPHFKAPQVYLYSSALQSALDPVMYSEDLLFIDVSGFMGSENKYYRGVFENYLKPSLDPAYLLPKVAYALAETQVPFPRKNQKFIDLMLYYGKILTLEDAFLPDTPDYLKINYTPDQEAWAKANEENIWNFFVEHDLVFSDDPNLGERFLSVAPFSKFYAEVDQESPPQIGIWVGHRICQAFYQRNKKTALQDFLQKDAQDLLKLAQYKP